VTGVVLEVNDDKSLEARCDEVLAAERRRITSG